MNTAYDFTGELQEFSGTAPLFPLSEVVAFPNILLPLQVSEPGLCRLVADALAGDRFLATALPKASREASLVPELSALEPMACLARIVSEERLPDGRYHLLAQGLARARVAGDATHASQAYPAARLELCRDRYPHEAAINREARRAELLTNLRNLFADADLGHAVHPVAVDDVPLGVLCDVLAYALRLPSTGAQRILEELNVDVRSDLVLGHIREMLARETSEKAVPGFPPRFSPN